MKVIITGFQPFGKETINPSYEAVRLLPDEIAGAQIIKLQIPVVFGKAGEILAEAIRKESPDVVICVGQAGGRTCMSIERVAINWKECSADFPDNDGNSPSGNPVQEDGENAYFATIPIKAMVEHMKQNHIPAAISNTAGTYVCNDLMYNLLYTLDKEFPKTRGGFIHVPYATEQCTAHPNFASMSIPDISAGLKFGIEAAILNEKDLDLNLGATH